MDSPYSNEGFFTKYRYPLFFILLFSGICLFYNFHEIFHYGPRSTHQWRQSDSASIALNYYNDGLNFFKPRTHYVMGGEGYVTGPGEAPLFYYLVALFYKLFGPYEGIFRTLSLCTLLFGFYLVGKIILQQTEDIMAALFVPALLMGSPVIAFYSFNFTPNIPAQGLAMTGIWFFYLFYQKNRLHLFYLSMLFFLLAGLIKISSLIPFLVIFGLWLMEALTIVKLKKNEQLFKNSLKIVPAFLALFAVMFFWKLFADHYNEVHQSSYFASKIRPVWSIDFPTITSIFENILFKKLNSYFHVFTLMALAGIGALIILTPRKHPPVLYVALLFYSLGCVAFFLLMFRQFEHHDYYVIDMLLLPALVIAMFILFVKNSFPLILKKWWFRLILGSALIFNFYHAKTQLRFRYELNSASMAHFNPAFYKKEALQDYLDELGVLPSDKVVSAPDLSPNNTLYYLNLRGWTEYFMGGPLNPLVMEFFLSAGAQYLIISDESYLKKEELKPFLKYPLGVFENSIFVFDIRPYKLEEVKIND